MTVGTVLKSTYTYNGLEQVTIRVLTNMTPSGTTHFIYDRFGNLIAETAGGGATGSTGTVREYIYLPETEISPTFGSRTVVDRPLAVVNAVNTTPVIWAVHVDHLNRPIKMTDTTKASVWTAQWLPWGNVFAITGTATLDARFPGQWFQLESGLHYNWYRHYDPTIGRFTQPDPLGFVDGPSVYAYGRSSPARFVDFDGLSPSTAIGWSIDRMRRPGQSNQSTSPQDRATVQKCTAESNNKKPNDKKQCPEGDFDSCFRERFSACAVGNGALCGLGCYAVDKLTGKSVMTWCLTGCGAFFVGSCAQSIKYQCHRDCD